MVTQTTGMHWGSWVKARARLVGFRRQFDLAQLVGCGKDKLSKWVNMATPPVRMHKGFDVKLAYARQTDRNTLFSNWNSVAPGDAPTVDSFRVMTDDDLLRRKVQAIVDLLDPPELAVLHDKGRELLASGAARANWPQ